jgi:inner membrane protein
MMWHTHAAIGASTAWLFTPFLPLDGSVNVAVLMAYCVVGATVPDLDAVESKIKHVKVMSIKPLVPVSIVINRGFGHRGLLHSLWGWVGWTLLVLPLSMVIGWLSVAALSLGYASHLAGDACTRSGISLLYPKRDRFHLFPQRWCVITGSEYEEIFFSLFALSTVAILLEHLVS